MAAQHAGVADVQERGEDREVLATLAADDHVAVLGVPGQDEVDRGRRVRWSRRW